MSQRRLRESTSTKKHRRDDHQLRRAERYFDGDRWSEEWGKGYEARYAEARGDHAADYWTPHMPGDGIPVDTAGQVGTPFPDAPQQPYYYTEPATRRLLPPQQQQQQQQPHSPVGQSWSPAPSSLTYPVEGWDTNPWQVPAAKDGGGGDGGGGSSRGRDDAGPAAGRREMRFELGDVANTEVMVRFDPRHPRVPLNITIDATGRITINELGSGEPG